MKKSVIFYVLMYIIWSISIAQKFDMLSFWDFFMLCILFRLLIWGMDGIIQSSKLDEAKSFKKISSSELVKDLLVIGLFLIFCICEWIGFI